MDVVECVPDKGVIGKQFRKEAKPILEWMSGLDESAVKEMEESFQTKGYDGLRPNLVPSLTSFLVVAKGLSLGMKKFALKDQFTLSSL